MYIAVVFCPLIVKALLFTSKLPQITICMKSGVDQELYSYLHISLLHETPKQLLYIEPCNVQHCMARTTN